MEVYCDKLEGIICWNDVALARARGEYAESESRAKDVVTWRKRSVDAHGMAERSPLAWHDTH